MSLFQKSKLLYQLKLTNQELVTTFENSTGFSITRYEMLCVIRQKEKCSQTQIQVEMGIDRAAVTRHLKRLEEKQYIIRKRNAHNQREIEVEITEKAITELEHCNDNHSTLQTLNFGLTDAEETQLLTLLEKIKK